MRRNHRSIISTLKYGVLKDRDAESISLVVPSLIVCRVADIGA